MECPNGNFGSVTMAGTLDQGAERTHPQGGGSYSDALTQVASQQAFDYELNRRFAEWDRRRIPVSVVLAGVDGFDRIEAEFGRDASEDILCGMGHRLSAEVREMDLPTRHKRDAFSIILPDTTIFGARHVAQRVCSALTSATYALPEKQLMATVSIGVASVVAGDDEQSLLDRAQAALDISRECEGNCVRFHDGWNVVAKLDDYAQLVDRQFAHARRIETIGRLAAGVAHEINTPVQYVGDNLRFLEDAFSVVCSQLKLHEQLSQACEAGQPTADIMRTLRERTASVDLDFLYAEVPRAIELSLEGIQRVAHIARSLKEFSRKDATSKTATDIHEIIQRTLTLSESEWKYAAEVVTEFDGTLPAVPILPGEFAQVMMNLVVNAAQAISESVGRSGEKGTITISTRANGNFIEVQVRDTGPGIPEECRSRIFDSFFTTKPPGVGSGQGLGIVREIVVDQHGGTVDFETEQGSGTTFLVRLPVTERRGDVPE